MNIFVLHEDPTIAATMYCDKHVPKMVVELYQQLGSAVIRHGATPDVMPLTKKGTPQHCRFLLCMIHGKLYERGRPSGPSISSTIFRTPLYLSV